MARTAARRKGWRWPHGRAGWGAALVILACSCLVTDQAEFGEPIVPSTLEPVRPIGVVRVPSTPDADCTTLSKPLSEFTERELDMTSWMAFEVEVTDANVEDDLGARLVVNGQEAAAGVVPRSGEAYRGKLLICAQLRYLNVAACNRVEMLVTTGFHVLGAPYRPLREGDLGRWEWWVLGRAADFPEIRPSDCAPDGGT